MGFDDITPLGTISRDNPDLVWNGSDWEPHKLGNFDQRFKDKWPMLKRQGDRWLPHLHLFISTPVYDGCAHNTYMRSALNMAMAFRQIGIDVQFSWPRGDGIARCRNRQIAEFLSTPATHLVCIDADIGFQPQQLLNMITAYQDVVFGAYPAKGIEWEQIVSGVKDGKIANAQQAEKSAVRFVVNFCEEDIAKGEFPGIQFADGRSFLRLKEGSTGFMVIRREVIEKMIAAYPERAYQDDYPGPTHGKRMFDLFHMGMDPTAANERAVTALKAAALGQGAGGDIDSLVRAAWEYKRTHAELLEKNESLPRYLSEDYGFCRLWTGIGGEVYVYTDAQLSHVGQYVYEGAFSQVFRAVNTTVAADNASATVTSGEAPKNDNAQAEAV